MSNPFLPNIEPLVQLGIDPTSAFNTRAKNCPSSHLKADMINLLSVVDRQDAINRFKWENLPNGLTSELIERMLYYRGQVAFFRMRADGNFYVLPYTLAGNIDCYGRWEAITPLAFTGTNTSVEGKPWISGLIKTPVYNLEDDYDLDDAAILIRDYTPGIAQTVTPRATLNHPLLDVEADCIPFLRTALLNSTGVQGIRVTDEDTSANVLAASRAIDGAALNGQKYVPIVGSLEFQDLTTGTTSQASEFLMTMQALDNLRLQMLGIKNGGIFTKKEHVLQEEQDLNGGSDEITMNDALEQRQTACDQINNIFGLDVTVRPNTNEEEPDNAELPDD